jgi:hypothetical protein
VATVNCGDQPCAGAVYKPRGPFILVVTMLRVWSQRPYTYPPVLARRDRFAALFSVLVELGESAGNPLALRGMRRRAAAFSAFRGSASTVAAAPGDLETSNCAEAPHDRPVTPRSPG